MNARCQQVRFISSEITHKYKLHGSYWRILEAPQWAPGLVQLVVCFAPGRSPGEAEWGVGFSARLA